MSKIKSVLAAALTLAVIGSAANAAPFTQTVGNYLLTVTTLGTPLPNGPVAGNETVTGYTAYDVSITSLDGSNITGLQFNPDDAPGHSGLTGFTGTILQEWDEGRTSTTPTADITPAAGGGPGGYYSLDSHFLIDASNPTFLTKTAMAETNSAVKGNSATQAQGTPGDDGFDLWGIGNSMTFTAGFGPANPPTAPVGLASPTIDIAYLVIPNSGMVDYNFAVTNNVDAEIFSGTIPGGTSVPEPMSLGILGLGAAALIARRKNVTGVK